MVGPDFKKPKAPDVNNYTNSDLPDKTASAKVFGGASQEFSPGKEVPYEWWKQFGSESLNALVEQAIAGNPDLKAADASLRQAQENYYATRGDLFPQVDAKFSPTREKFSSSSFGSKSPSSSIFTLYNASVSVSYALDIFGGTKRALEGAGAEKDYQEYVRRAAYLSLTANVVTAAIQEASLNQQIKETKNIIEIESKQLKLLRKQLALGAITKSAVLQQEATLAQTKTNLPPLEKQLAQQHNTLAVLAGKLPGNYENKIFDLSTLKLPEKLPISLPSKLVERRPDILAAEAQLHEASAAIGVATSNMLPQLSLTGSYGSQANKTGNMFSSGSEVWSFGGSVLQPLFNGGQLLHSKRATIAAYDKATMQYQSTVLQAFKDVADTLKALQFDAEGLAAQVKAEVSAKNSLDLAQTQFSSGAISYPQLLDAQRTYQEARIGLVQAQAARLSDTAALCQSLGGSIHDYENPKSEESVKSTDDTKKKTNFISTMWQKIKKPRSVDATSKMPEHE